MRKNRSGTHWRCDNVPNNVATKTAQRQTAYRQILPNHGETRFTTAATSKSHGLSPRPPQTHGIRSSSCRRPPAFPKVVVVQLRLRLCNTNVRNLCGARRFLDPHTNPKRERGRTLHNVPLQTTSSERSPSLALRVSVVAALPRQGLSRLCGDSFSGIEETPLRRDMAQRSTRMI